jgi:transcription elongation factor Elf1
MYQSKTIFQCPNCNENIVREVDDEIVFRNRILKTKKQNNDAIVRCPHCKQDIKIPYKVTHN